MHRLYIARRERLAAQSDQQIAESRACGCRARQARGGGGGLQLRAQAAIGAFVEGNIRIGQYGMLSTGQLARDEFGDARIAKASRHTSEGSLDAERTLNHGPWGGESNTPDVSNCPR